MTSQPPHLPHSTTDDLGLLLAVLPPRVRKAIEALGTPDSLIEVVLDLGRAPEARLIPGRTVVLSEAATDAEDLAFVARHVGRFRHDNRAGIERTLHRISAIRNRDGGIVGLTCRIGRAVFGTLEIVRDVVLGGASVLLLGRPGVGKTTLLREAARVLASDAAKRVVVVDTSNEIAGDGDIAHPGIGLARRMQVASPDAQHAVMIEAVENHMPEVVVIDEIGTQAEALAARTIAERGVQLIATAHGNALENLLKNPTLADLVGGIQTVILSDEEARRRRSQKTVPERRAEPTFPVLIEIRDRDHLAVYRDVAAAVDARLRGVTAAPEMRRRGEDGRTEIVASEAVVAGALGRQRRDPAHGVTQQQRSVPRSARRTWGILPFAVDRRRLERAIEQHGIGAELVDDLDQADLVVTIKAQERRTPRCLRDARRRGVPIAVLKSNTQAQADTFVRTELVQRMVRSVEGSLGPEVETAIDQVLDRGLPVALEPCERRLRRLEHVMIHDAGLASSSRGREPFRHVVIYPA